jgi:DNA-binding response OmpR family regulator
LYESSDVRTFVREVLISAGYNAMTVANIDDAKILLKATKAKLVLMSVHLQSYYGRPTSRVLQEIDPAISLVVLDENFATLEPGDAAQKLLNSVGAQ